MCSFSLYGLFRILSLMKFNIDCLIHSTLLIPNINNTRFEEEYNNVSTNAVSGLS